MIGESLRNKSVMVQIIIVALILNIFAVVPAVFIMLVLDKVVNYEAYSTLYVITSGVIVAYLFNGILGFLRAYLLDFLSQKVEAKLSIWFRWSHGVQLSCITLVVTILSFL